jgi:2-polyprenyl-3-methyl-5-hydroxy-6-metoxy-1,4-benzoquinol methylase
MRYFYKGTLDYSSHNQIADLIIERKPKKVLEIGCNEGFIGKALRRKKYQGFLTGVDIDKQYKKVVKKGFYDQFLNIDIERELGKIKGKYDGIIFADVLEHLDKPWQVLHASRKKIKKNGFFIVSLPNIGNLYVRLKLLLGNFDYADYGILDKEHRHFFTYKTALQFVKRNGFVLVNETCTPIPTPLLHPLLSQKSLLFFTYYLARLLSLIRKELFAYQFIFVCQPKGK